MASQREISAKKTFGIFNYKGEDVVAISVCMGTLLVAQHVQQTARVKYNGLWGQRSLGGYRGR
jgi:hypothetical protein